MDNMESPFNIRTKKYQELKQYYDNVLNKDKSSYKSSNDEPTPIGCIEEILSKIPNEFWQRDTLKILDPCCGNGNWHLVAMDFLIKAGKTLPDSLDSFYFRDINQDRLQNVRRVFDNPTNISAEDFLDMKAGDKAKYDLVMANPPYAKLMQDGKRASKNHTLIRDFILKSLDCLNDDGYLAFLVPDNWMSLADRNLTTKMLTKYQFIWLNIHGAKKWFPKIGSSFTWFVVKKAPADEPFSVEYIFKGKANEGQVCSQVRSYIPLLYNKTIQSILSKTLDKSSLPKYKVETSSDLHKYTKRNLIQSVKDDAFTYKLIHTPKQVVWSSRPHKYQEGYKVFISTTDKYATFIDDCGMTQSIAFVRCASMEEAETINKILQHDLYKFLNNICRWGNFNNIRIMQLFPIPQDRSNIWKSFELTETEVEFVKSIASQ
jgi:adenine-specific DNA-methyltransferase